MLHGVDTRASLQCVYAYAFTHAHSSILCPNFTWRSLVRRGSRLNFVRSLNFQWFEHECVSYVGGSPVEFF